MSAAEREHERAVWIFIVHRKAQFDDLPIEIAAELKKGVEDVR